MWELISQDSRDIRREEVPEPSLKGDLKRSSSAVGKQTTISTIRTRITNFRQRFIRTGGSPMRES